MIIDAVFSIQSEPAITLAKKVVRCFRYHRIVSWKQDDFSALSPSLVPSRGKFSSSADRYVIQRRSRYFCGIIFCDSCILESSNFSKKINDIEFLSVTHLQQKFLITVRINHLHSVFGRRIFPSAAFIHDSRTPLS